MKPPPTFDDLPSPKGTPSKDIYVQLEKWHLLEECTGALDQVAPPTIDREDNTKVLEIKLDLESVSETLKMRLHLSLLLYFID